jgi:hypothetical protein
MVARECIIARGPARLIRATNGQDINLNSGPFLNPVHSRESPRFIFRPVKRAESRARERERERERADSHRDRACESRAFVRDFRQTEFPKGEPGIARTR